MFSKTAKPEKASVKSDASLSAHSSDPARNTLRPASLISEDITIDGAVTGEGDLHVDGVIRGDVRIGHLTIGETGHIEGSIQAETVEARGRVIGTLTAKQVQRGLVTPHVVVSYGGPVSDVLDTRGYRQLAVACENEGVQLHACPMSISGMVNAGTQALSVGFAASEHSADF